VRDIVGLYLSPQDWRDKLHEECLSHRWSSFCRERQNSSVEWAFPAFFGDMFYLPG
jgi:hypothetical protein